MTEQSHNQLTASRPVLQRPVAWRVFLECAFALIDVLDAELRAGRGMTLRWYDVLVQLDESPRSLRMNELAERILASKSNLTRVIDRMEEAGLVSRARPQGDRRVVEVSIEPAGAEALRAARVVHHAGIQEHFARHLSDADADALVAALEGVRDHVRPLRPGRVSG